MNQNKNDSNTNSFNIHICPYSIILLAVDLCTASPLVSNSAFSTSAELCAKLGISSFLMNSFYHCCGFEYPVEYYEHGKRLAELTDTSILFMRADLDIHCSDVRLRFHSKLAEMDEYLLSVG
ncbi:hypothetical protein T01_3184 [Trichinella spiralis]|uniref:Uncharacterized protein n=1 Tax=Trichinella spiralis TaxID=6334 RepID=A0A0V1AMC0_TRISP|nr:hypothetical protein T01_3855 [Trichinella spiralis]KRY25962.1 hypothetical protein T01_3184 [Trichinella spiralis]